MNRRKFLQNITLGSGAVLLSFNGFGQLLSSKKSSKLTILHTNDTHSNIDPFPSNHAKFPGMGGVSRRHALIQKIRQNEEHVLLLDCGDIFQGTPYFNMFNGELEMKLMSEIGYDAATMGNHDFDIGIEGFKNAKRHAKFSFLCANYDFSETILSGETKSFEIFQKGDLKIGVFGIGIELNGLVTENNYGKTKYLDPILTANSVAKELKQKGCDLVICLSHLGYDYPDSSRISDRKLAQQTSNIDIILGGHTHTFLEKPIIEKNKKGKSVLINQVGYAGLYLGRIDIDITSGAICKNMKIN
ncbi:MAG: bifunctional metallophosphatase/5'-nucleotidase [Bacteroidetes bacterium]|nr:bifunctional metallophosphatase/5'-nucleotidase [Bacteroidota bacterium]